MSQQSKCNYPECENGARRKGLCDRHRYEEKYAAPDRRRAEHKEEPELSPLEQIQADRVKLATKAEESALKLKYTAALAEIERLETALDAGLSFPMPNPCLIEPQFGSGERGDDCESCVRLACRGRG